MIKPVILIFASFSLTGCIAFVPLFEDDPFGQMPGFASSKTSTTVATKRRAVAAKRKVSRTVRRDQMISKHIANLKHPDAVVRIHAASYLGDYGAHSKRVVDPLITSLRDPHYWVRRTAAKSLGRIRAGRAIPALKQSLSDKDRYVAHTARNALKRIYASSYPTHN